MATAVGTPNAPVGIRGVGHYLPAHRLDNHDLAALGSPVSPEWIVAKTGIRSRHVADDSQAMSDLLIPAARAAMTAADVTSVDAVVVAGDNLDFGGVRLTSGVVATALGLDTTTIYDLRVGCPGSVLGLHFGVALVASGLAERALLAVGATAAPSGSATGLALSCSSAALLALGSWPPWRLGPARAPTSCRSLRAGAANRLRQTPSPLGATTSIWTPAPCSRSRWTSSPTP